MIVRFLFLVFLFLNFSSLYFWLEGGNWEVSREFQFLDFELDKGGEVTREGYQRNVKKVWGKCYERCATTKT